MKGFRFFTMRKLMISSYLFLCFGLFAMPVLFAEVDPAVKLQVIGVLVVAIPPITGLLKKLSLPAWLVPLLPLLLGALTEVALVLLKMSDLTLWAATLVGIGVGGAASSGYDLHKKWKEALKK